MCKIMIFLAYAAWQQLSHLGDMDHISGKIQLLCVLQARIAQKQCWFCNKHLSYAVDYLLWILKFITIIILYYASWQQWANQGDTLHVLWEI